MESYTDSGLLEKNMRAELIKAASLKYDPFDEDVCGSYNADKLIIHCGYQEHLKINIQEVESGIGSSYEITATNSRNGAKSQHRLWVYVDDGGELNFYIK